MFSTFRAGVLSMPRREASIAEVQRGWRENSRAAKILLHPL